MAAEQDLQNSYNERIKQLMLMVAGAQDSIRGQNADLQGRLGATGADLATQSAGVGNSILQLLQQTRARQQGDINPLLADLQRHNIRTSEFDATNAGQMGYFDEQYARQGALQQRLAQIGQEDLGGRKMSADALATGTINDVGARGTMMGAGIEQERAQALAELRASLAAQASAGRGGGGGGYGGGGGRQPYVRDPNIPSIPNIQNNGDIFAQQRASAERNKGKPYIPTLSTIGLGGTRQSKKRPTLFDKGRRNI